MNNVSGIGATGGILSSKSKLSVSSASFVPSSSSNVIFGPRPLNTLSLRRESSQELFLSTNGGYNQNGGKSHAGAGWGSSTKSNSETTPQPAWGLADKNQHQSSNPPATNYTSLAPKGRISAGYHLSTMPASSNNTKNNQTQVKSSGAEVTEKAAKKNKHENSSRNRKNFKQRNVKDDSIPKSIGIDYSSQDKNTQPDNLESKNKVQNNSTFEGAYESIVDSTPDSHDASKHKPHTSGIHQISGADSSNVSSVTRSSLGENLTAEKSEESELVECQVEFMKQKAKERAEAKKAEEIARMNAQKERANRRLKELEDKIQSNNNEDLPVPEQSKGNWRSRKSKNLRSNNDITRTSTTTVKSEIVLEKLGRQSKQAPPGTVKVPTQKPAPNSTPKALFDPSRTYSSLVGGSKVSRNNTNHEKKNLSPEPKKADARSPPPPVPSISVHTPHKEQQDSTQDAPPPVAIIQLTSYEDSNRGERSTPSGPRMLFDPKSGSMVKAPSQDKRSHHNTDEQLSSKNRKDRAKQKIRNRADTQSGNGFSRKNDGCSIDDLNKHKNTSGEIDDFGDNKGNRRHRKKDDLQTQRKDRKRSDKELKSVTDNTDSLAAFDLSSQINDNRLGNDSNAKRNQKLQFTPSRIPRTCGVLYRMTDDGNFISADGCDADHGYGAHSVPGGRVRNPSVYRNYMDQVRTSQHNMNELAVKKNELNRTAESYYPQSNTKGYMYHHSFSGNVNYHYPLENRIPPTGFGHYNQVQKHANQVLTSAREFSQETEVPPDMRVKANETLSILTSAPLSPKLQATAHAWSPNEAALAAAAAAAASSKVQQQEFKNSEPNVVNEEDDHLVAVEMMKIIDEHEDIEAEKESDSSFLGLGFDPTKNMDSVITSPISEKPTIDESNISTFSLVPPLSSEGPLKSNPFSPLGTPNRFLGSTTWGTVGSILSPENNVIEQTAVGALDWNIFSENSAESLAPSRNNNANNSTAATFLGLSPLTKSGSTWGTGNYGSSSIANLGDVMSDTSRNNNGGHDIK